MDHCLLDVDFVSGSFLFRVCFVWLTLRTHSSTNISPRSLIFRVIGEHKG